MAWMGGNAKTTSLSAWDPLTLNKYCMKGVVTMSLSNNIKASLGKIEVVAPNPASTSVHTTVLSPGSPTS